MRNAFGVCLTLLLLFAAGCAKDAITVNGEGISKELFDYVVKERLKTHKGLNVKVDEKAVRKSVSDELVAEALLIQEAKARKITVSEDEQQKAVAAMRRNKSEKDFKEELRKSGMSYTLFLARVKSGLLITKLMATVVGDDSVTEEEMKESYTKSPLPPLKPEKDFVRIMQFNDEATAREAREKLKKGGDFDTMADEVEKSGKAFATSYGWIDPRTLSEEMSNAMRSAKLNTVYGPVKGKDGSSYYLFRIKERQAPEVLSFEDAKPQIRAALLRQKRQAAAAQLVETRKKTAKIKFNVPV